MMIFQKRYFLIRFIVLAIALLGVRNGFSMEDDELKFAELPVGLTSFGGAVVDGKVYVYGGHAGDAHSYYKGSQNTELYQLDLANPNKWNVVGSGIGLQGLAMVGHKDNLYRLGGFEARNAKGDEQDLHSVDQFAQFDFESKKWQQLVPMPIARSSFDAVVVGDKIYVVGGWTLAGDGSTQWCDDAFSIDLSEDKLSWTKLATPPFKRRAVSLGYQGDKVFVVGGMQEVGGPTKKVSVFDIESGAWSEGPELPGEEGMEGFGNSSFNIGGTLAATTYSGAVLHLNEEGTRWHKINQMETGRFFHRLLPLSKSKFILVGGANMESGKTNDVVVYDLEK